MGMKKTAGLTETRAPQPLKKGLTEAHTETRAAVSNQKQTFIGGHTETPRAILGPTSKIVHPDTRGQAEAPAAKPQKPLSSTRTGSKPEPEKK